MSQHLRECDPLIGVPANDSGQQINANLGTREFLKELFDIVFSIYAAFLKIFSILFSGLMEEIRPSLLRWISN
jgi:hypothetical protein